MLLKPGCAPDGQGGNQPAPSPPISEVGAVLGKLAVNSISPVTSRSWRSIGHHQSRKRQQKQPFDAASRHLWAVHWKVVMDPFWHGKRIASWSPTSTSGYSADLGVHAGQIALRLSIGVCVDGAGRRSPVHQPATVAPCSVRGWRAIWQPISITSPSEWYWFSMKRTACHCV